MRDICRGHDDAGNPVLTPEKCEAYRRRWFEKAASLGGAIMRHIGQGCRSVLPETFDARLSTCKACDHFDKEREVCKMCGCKLTGNLLAKLRMPAEKCPDGRWAEETP
jgi:hypothetical protein